MQNIAPKLLNMSVLMKANRTKQYNLWNQYYKKVEWIQDCTDLILSVKFGNRSAQIHFSFAEINGDPVGFYYTDLDGDSQNLDDWMGENIKITLRKTRDYFKEPRNEI